MYHGVCSCFGVESVTTSNRFSCTAATAPVKSTEATFLDYGAANDGAVFRQAFGGLVDVADSCDDAYGVGGCLGGEALDDAAAGFGPLRRRLVDVADSCDDAYGASGCLGGEVLDEVAAGFLPVAS